VRSNQELVDFIRLKAHSCGMSVTDLEKLCGLSNGRIGKWASKKSYPSHDILLKVANILKVPLQELTGENEAQKESPAAQKGNGAKGKLHNIIDGLSDEQAQKMLGFIETML